MKKVVTKVHISIVFLLIACFLSTTNISAKSTPKINHKSYNITISSTVTLKISNANTNVKWSSNKPSVAKIIRKSGSKSYKAKIKGLKAGTAKITANLGNKKLVCTIKVKAKKKNTSVTVYVTPTGYKYHRTKGCPTLSRSKTIYSYSLNKAISSGYKPCKKCY